MGSYSLAQLGFLIGLFAFVSGTPIAIYFVLRRNAVQRRIDRAIAGEGVQSPVAESATRWVQSVVKVAKPLARLSLPDEGWEGSQLRRRFIQAGLRDPGAPMIFFAVKSLSAFGLPLVRWLVRSASGSSMPLSTFFFAVAALSCAGFFLPNFVLRRLLETRQREIFEAFPDAIDLLTICVEAGLSLEAALVRVAEEIQIKSEVLAEELQLVCLEFRAGSSRGDALRNLALRTGVEDIDTLVAMLVQSEKFGSSIGESLRVHARMLRVKRQQRAEEVAAKISVKLIFPLLICIFPSILIVAAGPAMINIGRTLKMIFG